MKTTLSVYECGEFHNLGKSFIGYRKRRRGSKTLGEHSGLQSEWNQGH